MKGLSVITISNRKRIQIDFGMIAHSLATVIEDPQKDLLHITKYHLMTYYQI